MTEDRDSKPDFTRMITKDHFISQFWERLNEARRASPSISREKVFNEMNEFYYQVTLDISGQGIFRYRDYDSFNRVLKREKAEKTHAKKSTSRQLHAKAVG